MKSPYIFGATLSATAIAVLCFVTNAQALSDKQIEQAAQAFTVRLEWQIKDGSVIRTENGSGIIIRKQGNLYTLVTSKHVVCGDVEKCIVPKTSVPNLIDGERYTVKSVEFFNDSNPDLYLDLAIVKFESKRNYSIAQLGNSETLKADQPIYVFGFPLALDQGQRKSQFSDGQALAVINKRLGKDDKGGHTIIYDAVTSEGMSGGGVFDREGRVVAIHGQGDVYQDGTDSLETNNDSGKRDGKNKIGNNRGIPINFLARGLQRKGINIGIISPENELPPNNITEAEELLVRGYNQWIYAKGDADKDKAIELWDKAIKLNPKQAKAHFFRSYTLLQLKKPDQALEGYNFAIDADPKFAFAYYLRGITKHLYFKDLRGALADFNQAIKLKPKLGFYNNRAVVKRQLNDIKGALADYDKAIEINPKYAPPYVNRAFLRFGQLQDYKGASADVEKAIKLDPELAFAYVQRGIMKLSKLKDTKGALSDCNKAIELDSKNAVVYYFCGVVKENNKDFKGAISNFRQAIQLSQQYPENEEVSKSIEKIESHIKQLEVMKMFSGDF
jgi:tetratricopeptide (TPR) repeat protein